MSMIASTNTTGSSKHSQVLTPPKTHTHLHAPMPACCNPPHGRLPSALCNQSEKLGQNIEKSLIGWRKRTGWNIAYQGTWNAHVTTVHDTVNALVMTADSSNRHHIECTCHDITLNAHVMTAESSKRHHIQCTCHVSILDAQVKTVHWMHMSCQYIECTCHDSQIFQVASYWKHISCQYIESTCHDSRFFQTASHSMHMSWQPILPSGIKLKAHVMSIHWMHMSWQPNFPSGIALNAHVMTANSNERHRAHTHTHTHTHLPLNITVTITSSGTRETHGFRHTFWHARDWHIKSLLPPKVVIRGVILKEQGKNHSQAVKNHSPH